MIFVHGSIRELGSRASGAYHTRDASIVPVGKRRLLIELAVIVGDADSSLLLSKNELRDIIDDARRFPRVVDPE